MGIKGKREMGIKGKREMGKGNGNKREKGSLGSLLNRAARSPQGPGTKSTMDKSKSESRSTANGKETSDIDQ
jgi:hypothetical protein